MTPYINDYSDIRALHSFPTRRSSDLHIDARVKLDVNERRSVDVALEAGNVTETVTVTSAQLQVETQSAVASNVINGDQVVQLDRKSTRLNSSHVSISYAVFCLKKKTI